MPPTRTTLLAFSIPLNKKNTFSCIHGADALTDDLLDPCADDQLGEN